MGRKVVGKVVVLIGSIKGHHFGQGAKTGGCAFFLTFIAYLNEEFTIPSLQSSSGKAWKTYRINTETLL